VRNVNERVGSIQSKTNKASWCNPEEKEREAERCSRAGESSSEIADVAEQNAPRENECGGEQCGKRRQRNEREI